MQLLSLVEQALLSTLPRTWSISVDRDLPSGGSRRGYRPDGVATITAPDGAKVGVLIECKAAVVPRDVASLAEQLHLYANTEGSEGRAIGGALLAVPFVSPTTRAQLDVHGLGWFDTTGNFRLRLDRPAVFLDRVGADRSVLRDPADRLLKSLRGPAAAKVLLELCETLLPMGVRDLAERAQVGAATSARVLDLLDREAVIDREEHGSVTVVRKRALIERWVQDYHVMTSNEVVTTLDPRGLNHALQALSKADTRIAVTGSAAVRAYLPDGVTPVSPLVSLSLYAEDPIGLIEQLRLRAVDRGANVLVLRPYDEVVYTKATIVDGIAFAPPAQVVADLLTGPGRSSEEAEQLMAVLGAGDRGWVS
ncbi:transcriptional regulator with AbiEi antitoxin domain of type IV toxin-antitoxin system [Saccharothrix carnea]|uniref:Transcriptional regulator with AbiEi antitoxin domain of type IV toxin-antitoxin system n=1 Tax=Saccharothrix carnea TaxID=1280637 RepID=A0A2P8I6V6_SACCR|nr:transcriptional regulator with AbiEi antitoxin domain of type IV toxin-antitoxin system [Saccharothrix carnea]